jgi:hypothetical protein
MLAPVAARAQAGTTALEEPRGLTLEAGLALGVVRTGGDYSRLDSPTRGANLAAGVWLSPRTALTGRLVVQTYGWVSGDDSSDYRYWFVGPSVQHWLTPWAWISGGAGLALYQEASDGGPFTSSGGVGLDLRIGLAIGPLDGPHRLGLWLELTPAVYSYVRQTLPAPPAEWDAFVSATVNAGYQLR